MTTAKTHQGELERLSSLEQRAEQGGGPEAIARHHQRGKLTARERLDLLFDRGSFVEVNRLAESQAVDFGMQAKKVPGDGVVTGFGTVDGRPVFAYAQDVTVLGGSVGTIHGEKICRIMDEALKVKAPLVALNDSGGGRLHEGFFASRGVAGMFFRNTAASGVIPQITGMMGSCAGVSVYSPALTDFIVMVKGTSHMVITGPGVIKSVTGENVSIEDLGGAKVHSEVTGQAHFVTESDAECIRTIQTLLSYLPSNNRHRAPILDMSDSADRTDPALDYLIPGNSNQTYDMKVLIHSIMDGAEFMEIQSHFARNIICGLGRLGGQTVGLIANQPAVLAGVLDINASAKAALAAQFLGALGILVVATLALTSPIEAAAPPVVPGATYVGSDTCKGCHEAEATEMERTIHGKLLGTKLSKNEVQTRGCESCHGPGGNARDPAVPSLAGQALASTVSRYACQVAWPIRGTACSSPPFFRAVPRRRRG